MVKNYFSYLVAAGSLRAEISAWVNRLRRRKTSGLDPVFHQANDDAFEEIDCLKCANCCKTTSPLLTHVDVERMAKGLKMKPSVFQEKYTRLDEDGDRVMNQTPCPFLGPDNFCSVYEFRPVACRDYPHMKRKNMVNFLTLAEKNAAICPAVAKVLVALHKT